MNLRKLKIGSRLTTGFILVILPTLISSLWFIHEIKSIAHDTVNLYEHPFTVSNAMREIKADIIAIHRTMKDVVLSRGDREIDNLVARMQQYEDKIMEAFALAEDRFLGNKRDIEVARRYFIQWKLIREDVIYYMKTGQVERAIEITKNSGADHVRFMDDKIQIMMDFAGSMADSFLAGAMRNSRRAVRQLYLLMVLLPLLSFVVAYLVVRSITRPLDQMLSHMQEISLGDLSRKLDDSSNDEIGLLAKSVNRMTDGERVLTKNANAISLGDFSIDVKARSERDVLALAMQKIVATLAQTTAIARKVAMGEFRELLPVKGDKDLLAESINTMIGSLEEAEKKNSQTDWIKTGLGDLDVRMRGDHSLQALSKKIIDFLCAYTGAEAGAFYVVSADNEVFNLLGSHAFAKRKSMNSAITPGEGLLGEAAVQKEIVSLTSIPEDYTRIGSALGDALPRNIIIIPLLHENSCLGLVELCSFKEFSDTVLEFFKIASFNIAVSIASVRSRRKLEELFENSQRQTQELQVREEELQAINEELETQTSSLKESQEQLEKQQVELEDINAALEEKSNALENQKKEIEMRNQDLVRTREALEERAEDLALASKYKSEFLANMSHELRTPLNSLLILAQSLAENRDQTLTDKQQQSAEIIVESGKDLLNLINEILDLSKIEAGRVDLQMVEVDINDLGDTLASLFNRMAEGKGIDFHVDIAGDAPQKIYTDRKRLEQILRNFIANGIKFTHDGEVRLSFLKAAEGIKLSNMALTPETSIAIRVSDTGIGIPEEKHKAVFEAFQQVDGSTSRKYGGTGLGLSISRELTTILGGEIQLESALGKGSTFTLYLPIDGRESRKENASQIIEKSHAPVSQVKSRNAVITPEGKRQDTVNQVADDRDTIKSGDQVMLVVEDDLVFAGVLLSHCHERGFKVLVSHDGEQGMKLAEKYLPAGIILDLNLPGMSGWDVLNDLKNNISTRHIPVHLMTAEDIDSEAFKLGAIGFLTKPVDKNELEEAFGKFEAIINRKMKELLVVEDDDTLRKVIVELIGNGDVATVEAKTGAEATALLEKKRFDCMILDLGLPDMNGIDLLNNIAGNSSITIPPIIIYTGRDLSREEEAELSRYADSIILKDARSKERLLDETSLFLHRMVENMPESKKQMIAELHNRDQMFEGKKVLLVDDDMRNVFAVSSALEAKGMVVVAAEDGKKCLEVLAGNEDVDLVLMDVMMPEMDGYEATRKIRAQERFWKLPVIALTAKAMRDDRAKCIAAGASDYLSKPVDLERLFSMMRVWLYR